MRSAAERRPSAEPVEQAPSGGEAPAAREVAGRREGDPDPAPPVERARLDPQRGGRVLDQAAFEIADEREKSGFQLSPSTADQGQIALSGHRERQIGRGRSAHQGDDAVEGGGEVQRDEIGTRRLGPCLVLPARSETPGNRGPALRAAQSRLREASAPVFGPLRGAPLRRAHEGAEGRHRGRQGVVEITGGRLDMRGGALRRRARRDGCGQGRLGVLSAQGVESGRTGSVGGHPERQPATGDAPGPRPGPHDHVAHDSGRGLDGIEGPAECRAIFRFEMGENVAEGADALRRRSILGFVSVGPDHLSGGAIDFPTARTRQDADGADAVAAAGEGRALFLKQAFPAEAPVDGGAKMRRQVMEVARQEPGRPRLPGLLPTERLAMGEVAPEVTPDEPAEAGDEPDGTEQSQDRDARLWRLGRPHAHQPTDAAAPHIADRGAHLRALNLGAGAVERAS